MLLPGEPFFGVLQIKCFRRVSRGGKSPLHLFENWKLPLHEEKVPWLRPSVVQISDLKWNFYEFPGEKKRFWSCGAFLFRVLSESLSKCSNSKETPLSWLRAYVYRSALILRTLPWPEKFLVTRHEKLLVYVQHIAEQ